MEVPKEVIFRHAFRTAADYFAGKIEERRKAGFVPVIIEDTYETLYFMHCNERGYPNYYQQKYLEVPRLSAFLTVGEIPTSSTLTVHEVTIMVDKPMLMQRYDWQEPPVVFMWSGKRMGTDLVPIEKLNISELMRVAQAAIKNREGLVIDDALKNKIYK